jgi:hypothetical protein
MDGSLIRIIFTVSSLREAVFSNLFRRLARRVQLMLFFIIHEFAASPNGL